MFWCWMPMSLQTAWKGFRGAAGGFEEIDNIMLG